MNIFKVAKISAYILSSLWAVYIITQSTDMLANYITSILMIWNLLMNDLK